MLSSTLETFSSSSSPHKEFRLRIPAKLQVIQRSLRVSGNDAFIVKASNITTLSTYDILAVASDVCKEDFIEDAFVCSSTMTVSSDDGFGSRTVLVDMLGRIGMDYVWKP